jgi:hypothetical protein
MQVFVQLMVALYIFQAVMLALLSIKRFPWAPLLLPCTLLTALFHVAAGQLLRRPSEVLALQDARELDQLDAAAAGERRGQLREEEAASHGRSSAATVAAAQQAEQQPLLGGEGGGGGGAGDIDDIRRPRDQLGRAAAAAAVGGAKAPADAGGGAAVKPAVAAGCSLDAEEQLGAAAPAAATATGEQAAVDEAALAELLYQPPAFRSTRQQLQQLLDEVQEVRERLQRGAEPVARSGGADREEPAGRPAAAVLVAG